MERVAFKGSAYGFRVEGLRAPLRLAFRDPFQDSVRGLL